MTKQDPKSNQTHLKDAFSWSLADLERKDKSPDRALTPHLLELVAEAFHVKYVADGTDFMLEPIGSLHRGVYMPPPELGESLATLNRVAEIGTAVEFLKSKKLPGYQKAFKAVLGARNLLRLQVEIPRPPKIKYQTTVEDRLEGAPPTAYDHYVRDVALACVGMNFNLTEYTVRSLPDYREADWFEFAKKMLKATGQTLARIQKHGGEPYRADTFAGKILRDWLPRSLWRCSTRQSLQRLGMRITQVFVKNYDEVVRVKGLSESRQKS
jgi:hypothetical protein